MIALVGFAAVGVIIWLWMRVTAAENAIRILCSGLPVMEKHLRWEIEAVAGDVVELKDEQREQRDKIWDLKARLPVRLTPPDDPT